MDIDLALSCPAYFDQEKERAKRCVDAMRKLKKLGVSVKMVYYSWLCVESDWPADTVLAVAKDDACITVLISDEAGATVISGWNSPGS